jgi:hypothetical protein
MRIQIIMAIISLLGIGCAPTANTAQALKGDWWAFEDLDLRDYNSSIDTTFNYAEDIIEFELSGEPVLEEEKKRR